MLNRSMILAVVWVLFAFGCNGTPDEQVAGTYPVVTAASDYLAWPSVINTASNELLVVYTKTDEHMGPDGRIMAVRSNDDGQTWSDPYLVYDTPLDERESGLTLLADGSILLHVLSTMHTPSSYGRMSAGSYEDEIVKAWVERVGSDAYASSREFAGGRILRSTDHGKTWSDALPGPDTIHGGVQLANGNILVASYRETLDFVTINIAENWQGPWERVAEIRSPQPDSLRFGEPSVTVVPGGRVIVMMRVTTKPYNDGDQRCFLWQSYSDDDGRSWAEPFATPLWGFPPHLLTLADGSVLVAYGHRRDPFGQRAAVSKDGITWSSDEEIVLRSDAPNKDLGYPASAELSDGSILTVYYQSHVSDTLRPPAGPLPSRHKPDIYATRWVRAN